MEISSWGKFGRLLTGGGGREELIGAVTGLVVAVVFVVGFLIGAVGWVGWGGVGAKMPVVLVLGGKILGYIMCGFIMLGGIM